MQRGSKIGASWREKRNGHLPSIHHQLRELTVWSGFKTQTTKPDFQLADNEIHHQFRIGQVAQWSSSMILPSGFRYSRMSYRMSHMVWKRSRVQFPVEPINFSFAFCSSVFHLPRIPVESYLHSHTFSNDSRFLHPCHLILDR